MRVLREARPADIDTMHAIRLSVQENRLGSSITPADYVVAIAEPGRGWVAEEDGRVVGFAVGNGETGNVWALFVDPAHERRGHGRALHDAMVDWMRSRRPRMLWLTTQRGTRAERFYEAAGWTRTGDVPGGEVRFERAS